MILSSAVKISLAGKILRLIGMFFILGIYGRYISPEDIGIFAVIFISYQIFLPFLEGGLINSYLKSKSDKGFLAKLHSLNIILALLVSVFLLCIRPILEIIFNTNLNIGSYLLFLLFIFFTSITVQRRAYLLKNKKFDKIFIAEILGFLVGGVFSIYLAVNGWGYDAIIFRFLIEAIIIFLVYNFFFSIKLYMSKLDFNNNEKNLVIYGLKIAVSRFTTGITSSLDRILVGIVFSSAQLGFYFYSKNLVSMPDQLIRTSLTNPILPYIAKLDEINSYEELQKIAIFLSIILSTSLAVLVVYGDIFIELLMGQAWKEFGANFQILGFFGISLIIKGWLTIIFINNMKMNVWNRILLAEFMLLSIILLGCIYISVSMNEFVVAISTYFFIFWSICYVYLNFRGPILIKTNLVKSIIFQNQILIIFFMTLAIALLNKFYILNLDKSLFLNLASELLMLVPQILFIIYTFYKALNSKLLDDILYQVKSFLGLSPKL